MDEEAEFGEGVKFHAVTKQYFHLLFEPWVQQINRCETIENIKLLVNDRSKGHLRILQNRELNTQIYINKELDGRWLTGNFLEHCKCVLIKQLCAKVIACVTGRFTYTHTTGGKALLPDKFLINLYETGSDYLALSTHKIVADRKCIIPLTADDVVQVKQLDNFGHKFEITLPWTICPPADRPFVISSVMEQIKLHNTMGFILGVSLALIGSNIQIYMCGIILDNSFLFSDDSSNYYQREICSLDDFTAKSKDTVNSCTDRTVIISYNEKVYTFKMCDDKSDLVDGYKYGQDYREAR